MKNKWISPLGLSFWGRTKHRVKKRGEEKKKKREKRRKVWILGVCMELIWKLFEYGIVGLYG